MFSVILLKLYRIMRDACAESRPRAPARVSRDACAVTRVVASHEWGALESGESGLLWAVPGARDRVGPALGLLCAGSAYCLQTASGAAAQGVGHGRVRVGICPQPQPRLLIHKT